jgi:hypothetical protein
MKHKKAQTSTDTPIIIFLVAFQSFIFIALGFLSIDYEQKQVGTTINILGFDLGTWSFNLVTNVLQLGVWNILIFTPSVVAVAYIIVKLIRGGG